jgi:mannose-6-phosphate isomerase-like protein (cupin superfamily)
MYYLNFEGLVDLIIDLFSKEKPYTDERISSNEWIRTFDPSITSSEEYIWHRDKKDRNITVLEGEGWKFQFDNQIPFLINTNDSLYVPKNVYHRLIVGKTKLKLKIKEVG